MFIFSNKKNKNKTILTKGQTKFFLPQAYQNV